MILDNVEQSEAMLYNVDSNCMVYLVLSEDACAQCDYKSCY